MAVESLLDIPLTLILSKYGFKFNNAVSDLTTGSKTLSISLEYKNTGVFVSFLLESSLFVRVMEMYKKEGKPSQAEEEEVLAQLNQLKMDLYEMHSNSLPAEGTNDKEADCKNTND